VNFTGVLKVHTHIVFSATALDSAVGLMGGPYRLSGEIPICQYFLTWGYIHNQDVLFITIKKLFWELYF